MKYTSIFDVIGHIMVGPSSSHTAELGQAVVVGQYIYVFYERISLDAITGISY